MHFVVVAIVLSKRTARMLTLFCPARDLHGEHGCRDTNKKREGTEDSLTANTEKMKYLKLNNLQIVNHSQICTVLVLMMGMNYLELLSHPIITLNTASFLCFTLFKNLRRDVPPCLDVSS